MHSPGPNTDCSTISHAHPFPAQPSPLALEEQRLRELIARQTIKVTLRGLSCEHAVTVSDILTPKLRRSPFNEEVTASHLDFTECWKGLSHSQATELLMWYQFLHKCLEAEVRASLCNDLIKGLLRSEGAVDEVYLVPRMLDYLNSMRHRVVDVDIVDLIDSMMGMFHDRFPNAAAALSSNWSPFSGGLSLFLQNFLRIQDCFLEVPGGHCLLVDFEFKYVDSVLAASGDVTWHLPDVRFFNLSSSRSMGEEYRITPFVLREAHSPTSPHSSPGCDDYIDRIDYLVPRSELTFGWDALKQCFKTVLPNYDDNEPHTVVTILSVTITTPFPDHVRFERQSRWSIKLDVTPGKDGVSMIHANEDVKLNDSNRIPPWMKPIHGSIPADLCLGTKTKTLDQRALDQRTVLQKAFDNRLDPQSPQKRKVSGPDMVDTSINAKRRRRDSTHEDVYEPPRLAGNDLEKLRAWYDADTFEADSGYGGSDSPSTAQHIDGQEHPSSDPQSPQNRKVLKPCIVDEGRDGTRNRRIQLDEYDPRHMTREKLERMRAFFARKSERLQADMARAAVDLLSTTQTGADHDHAICPKGSSAVWYLPPERSDSPVSSPDVGARSSDSSAPNSAVETVHAAMQQDQILRNYREFAELKPYKDAGIISPVSDGERRVFESIFLENDEWSPVDDGSGVDLDTVMGEV